MPSPRQPVPQRRQRIWEQLPALLERSCLIVIALTAAVQLAVLLTDAPTAVGGWLALALILLGIAVSRRYHWPGLVLIAAGPIGGAFLGWHPIAEWSMACFAVLMLTVRGLPALPAALIVGAANLLAVWISTGTVLPSEDPEASIAAFAACLAAAAGSAVRSQRQYLMELQRSTQEALKSRAAAIDRGIAEERVRIAQDLHDSVGHRIAVVGMHLGAAEVRIPEGAAQVQSELDSARTQIQAVLKDTQQILRMLKPADGDPAPTPSYDRIPELVESFRTAGLSVEATVQEADRRLSAAASMAAYRIVQESLTNAQRHGAGGASLRVEFTERGRLTVETVNLRRSSEPGAPGDGGGHGLVGMRERAESAGGRLHVEDDTRLFWIRAELPVDA